MAIRQIREEHDEILRKKSRKVEKIDSKVLTLLDDMAETMKSVDGLGLAAVQVGVLRRIVVINVADDSDEVLELINPEIIDRKGKQNEIEGCLSCPGQYGYTNRPRAVTISAFDRKGRSFEITGEELLARAFCHELDHLEGILFTDHAEMLTKEQIEEMEKQKDK